jgi:hypothetical protein
MCAVCHERLDPRDIEYDHKKAWADKSRTIVVNGRAVCGSCHNKITHGQQLRKAEKRSAKKPQRSPLDDLLGIGGSKKKSSSNPLDTFGVKPYKKGKSGFGPF